MTRGGSWSHNSTKGSGGDRDPLRHRAVAWSWGLAAAAGAWLALFLLSGHLGGSTLALAALPLPAVVAAAAGRAAGAHGHVLAVLTGLPVVALVVALTLHVRPETAAISAIGVVSLTVPAWLIGRHVREREQLAIAGWNSALAWEREAQLAATHARMLERSALAAQMHDLLGHELAKAALLVGALELDRSTEQKVRQAAGDARRGISNAADRLYDAVRALDATGDGSTEHPAPRGPGANNFELVAACEAPDRIDVLIGQARAAGQNIVVERSLTAARFGACEPLTAGAVVAVVREGLTNAIKHAPGAPVRVSVRDRPDPLRPGEALSAGVTVDAPGVDVLVEIDTGARTSGPFEHAGPVAHATGTGRGLPALKDGIEALGGSVRYGMNSSGGHGLQARIPRRPSRYAGATADRGLESSTVRQRRTEEMVRRGGRQALLGVTGTVVAAVLLVVALTIINASTSLLPDSTFDTLRVGTSRTDLASLLPNRTRTEDPDTVPPPAGATCQYYSTRVNPLDTEADDLYRLCYKDGVLVAKDVLRPARGYVDPMSEIVDR